MFPPPVITIPTWGVFCRLVTWPLLESVGGTGWKGLRVRPTELSNFATNVWNMIFRRWTLVDSPNVDIVQ
jgi:hypothetical protein